MSLTDTAIKRLQPSDKCKPNQPDKTVMVMACGCLLDTQERKYFYLFTVIKANKKKSY